MKILECPTCGGDLIVLAGGITTGLAASPFFDQDGRAHYHDPNVTSTRARCAQDHWFIVETYAPCPSSECDYGEETWFTAMNGDTE